ncbi:MAG: DUF1992 domain-containing protein [Planctomycetota bacterium]|nr:DUF1992 domain-containing protein [Planctomycetota bacterium]
MAPARPPGKSWESYAEFMLRKAQEDGHFDNLPGTGKPIPGLDQPYNDQWWLKQWLKREDLECLPEALRFKAELHRETERLWRIPDEGDVRRRVAELNERIRRMHARIVEGPDLDVSEYDPEEIVERWRAKRVARG